jgi:hypothetical protein
MDSRISVGLETKSIITLYGEKRPWIGPITPAPAMSRRRHRYYTGPFGPPKKDSSPRYQRNEWMSTIVSKPTVVASTPAADLTDLFKELSTVIGDFEYSENTEKELEQWLFSRMVDKARRRGGRSVR